MTDAEKELKNQERLEKLIFTNKTASEKYVYYVLGLTVACIAFAINQSKTLPLIDYQIPLGVAVLFWVISFYFGIVQVQKFERYTDLNIIMLKSAMWKVKFEEKKDIEFNGLQDKINKFRNRQNYFFAFGSLAFIIWHILRMYTNC